MLLKVLATAAPIKALAATALLELLAPLMLLEVLMALAPLEVLAPLVPFEVLPAPALLEVCRLGGTGDSGGTDDAAEAAWRRGSGSGAVPALCTAG